MQSIQESPFEICVGPGEPSEDLVLERKWEGAVCFSTLTNNRPSPARITEVVLLRVAHALPPDTGFYEEGFTMLSKTAGMLGQPIDVGGYTDHGHYKIPRPEDAATVYGMMYLTPDTSKTFMFGFTACNRVVGGTV